MAEWVSELKVSVPSKTEGSPNEFENGSNVSSSTDIELSPGSDLQDHRTHHLLKHCLSNTQKDGALQHFTTNEVKEAAKDISRMGQRELQAKFKLVYGTSTHSNNNDWLRRKLYEAIGASPVKAASKGKPRKPVSKARKPSGSGELCGSPDGSASETRKRLARCASGSIVPVRSPLLVLAEHLRYVPPTHSAAETERKRLHTSLPATPLALHMRRRGLEPVSFASSSRDATGDEEDLLYYSTDVDTPRSEPVPSFHSLTGITGYSRPGSSAYHVQTSSRSMHASPASGSLRGVAPLGFPFRPNEFTWPGQSRDAELPLKRSCSLDVPSTHIPAAEIKHKVDHTWIPEGWTDMSADAGGLDLDVEPLDLPTGSSIALSSAQDDEVMMLQFSSLPGME